MKKIKLFYAIIITLTFANCDDYLDVKPKGLIIPESADDYSLMLNSSNLIYNRDYILHDSADDFIETLPFYLSEGTTTYNAITFKKFIFPADLNSNPTSWNATYSAIFTYNLILKEIDNATGESSLKASVKAEALLGRAYEYFLLVNTYGKHYDKSTAASDLAVPILTEENTEGNIVEEKVPARSTVQEVYDFIIKDITKAIPNLPTTNLLYRGTTASAYGLLARIYLYQGEYDKSKDAVDMALSLYNYLADYNTVLNPNLLIDAYNQEQIYKRGFPYPKTETRRALSGYTISNELQALFRPIDIRLGYFRPTGPPLNNMIISIPFNESHGISVPEMYLTRAECYARNGDLNNALKDLNFLRKNRIVSSVYRDFTSTNKDVVLKEILNERRRELAITGNRWFDLKRLNKEPAFAKDVVHQLGTQTYRLKPNSDNYVLPIPFKIMNYNPTLKQNPRTDIAPE